MMCRADQTWPEDVTVEIIEPSMQDALDYAVAVELFASVFEPQLYITSMEDVMKHEPGETVTFTAQRRCTRQGKQYCKDEQVIIVLQREWNDEDGQGEGGPWGWAGYTSKLVTSLTIPPARDFRGHFAFIGLGVYQDAIFNAPGFVEQDEHGTIIFSSRDEAVAAAKIAGITSAEVFKYDYAEVS